jgi:hypothetical protein
VIIVAAFPSVDGTAANQNESQKLIKEKTKVKSKPAAQFDKSLHISQRCERFLRAPLGNDVN